jgi:competence protein ComEA
MGVVGVAQETRAQGGLGKRIRRRARVLARRAGLSPAAKVGIAGIVIVAVLATMECFRLLPLQSGSSFVIERGETASAAESTQASEESQGKADEAPSEEAAEAPILVVHVDGMVASPGVYRLQGDSLRVNDAVEAAGGLVDGADTSRVNLAEPLTDGEKVHVPSVGEEDVGTVAASTGTSSSGVTATTTDGIVNINTATVAELTTLPGVGDATAAEIVRDREANGAFTSAEDLMRVSGIGEKKFAKLKDKIRV